MAIATARTPDCDQDSAAAEADGLARLRRRAPGVDPALLTPTAEQEELRSVVAAFLAEVSGPEQVRRHAELPDGFDPAVWRRLTAELGLAGIAVPERFGGAGAGFGELAVVLEEAGRRLLCAPLLPSAVLAVAALLATGDEAACAELLPGIAAGTTIATLAGTAGPTTPAAPGARRPAGLTARRSGTGWRLDGCVDFVLHGSAADLVLAAADSAAGPGLFAIRAEAEGLTRTALPVLDPTRPQARLELHGVPAQSLGSGGPAARQALDRALDVGRAAVAAEQVGLTGHVLRECIDYLRQRHQFGRPIGSFQAVKHRLADLLVELEGARAAAAYAVACVHGAPDELPLAAAVAQVACGEAAELAAREYVQLHGGIGFTWEHPAHRYLRRSRSDAVLFGTIGQHRLRVAELIGLGPSGARR